MAKDEITATNVKVTYTDENGGTATITHEVPNGK